MSVEALGELSHQSHSKSVPFGVFFIKNRSLKLGWCCQKYSVFFFFAASWCIAALFRCIGKMQESVAGYQVENDGYCLRYSGEDKGGMEKIKTGGLAKTIEVIATYNREVSLIFLWIIKGYIFGKIYLTPR